MISTLPKPGEPKWLMEIDDPANCDFPQQELLQGSFYYPASWVDGKPVACFAGNFFSFVYTDCGMTKAALHEEIQQRGFKGYEPLGCRPVSWEELTPNGRSPAKFDPSSSKYSDWIKPPFCEWYIFERQDGFDETHGPKRFSLLFLCEDGVNAFQWLYVDNKLAPNTVAVIQPGRDFYRGSIHFDNPEGMLAQAVMGNQSGHPEYLLFGGIGKEEFYEDSCWPQYHRERIDFLACEDTYIGIWKYRA